MSAAFKCKLLVEFNIIPIHPPLCGTFVGYYVAHMVVNSKLAFKNYVQLPFLFIGGHMLVDRAEGHTVCNACSLLHLLGLSLICFTTL